MWHRLLFNLLFWLTAPKASGGNAYVPKGQWKMLNSHASSWWNKDEASVCGGGIYRKNDLLFKEVRRHKGRFMVVSLQVLKFKSWGLTFMHGGHEKNKQAEGWSGKYWAALVNHTATGTCTSCLIKCSRGTHCCSKSIQVAFITSLQMIQLRLRREDFLPLGSMLLSCYLATLFSLNAYTHSGLFSAL